MSFYIILDSGDFHSVDAANVICLETFDILFWINMLFDFFCG